MKLDNSDIKSLFDCLDYEKLGEVVNNKLILYVLALRHLEVNNNPPTRENQVTALGNTLNKNVLSTMEDMALDLDMIEKRFYTDIEGRHACGFFTKGIPYIDAHLVSANYEPLIQHSKQQLNDLIEQAKKGR